MFGVDMAQVLCTLRDDYHALKRNLLKDCRPLFSLFIPNHPCSPTQKRPMEGLVTRDNLLSLVTRPSSLLSLLSV